MSVHRPEYAFQKDREEDKVQETMPNSVLPVDQ